MIPRLERFLSGASFKVYLFLFVLFTFFIFSPQHPVFANTISISASPTTITQGGNVAVTFNVSAGVDAYDYIGIIADDPQVESWYGIMPNFVGFGGQTNGTYTFYQMWLPPGTYTAHYYASDGTEASAPFTVVAPPPPSYSISASPTPFTNGSNPASTAAHLNISFTDSVGVWYYDYVSITDVNNPNNTISSGWLSAYHDQTNVTFTMDPSSLPPGTYVARYYYNHHYTNDFDMVAESAPFNITAPIAGYDSYSPQTNYYGQISGFNTGDKMPVDWVNPGGSFAGDTVQLFPIGANSSTPVITVPVTSSGTGGTVVTAPAAGLYEFRYVLANGTVAESGKTVSISAANSSYSVSVSPTPFTVGDSSLSYVTAAHLTAAFTSPFVGSYDYISITSEDGSHVVIARNNDFYGKTSGTVIMDPGSMAALPPGKYVARYYYNHPGYNNFDPVAYSAPFTIVAPLTGYDSFSPQTNTFGQMSGFNTGDQMPVDWVNPSGNFTGDTVQMFAIGPNSNTAVVTVPVTSRGTGEKTVTAPAPGWYEFRYVLANGTVAESGKTVSISAANPAYSISVSPKPFITSADPSTPAQLSISFTDSAGVWYYDYISVTDVSDPGNSVWSNWLSAYHDQTNATFNIYGAQNLPPGTYVARYYVNHRGYNNWDAVAYSAPFKILAPGTSSNSQVIWTAETSCNSGQVSYSWSGDDIPPGSVNPADSSNPTYSITYTTPGAKYATVTVTDDGGDTATAQCTVPVVVGPPITPTNLKATPGECGTNSIQLAWDSVSGASGYHVYRDGVQISSVIVPFYTDSGLVPGAPHSYTVDAYNTSGNSSQSVAASATTPAACTDQGGITCAAYRPNNSSAITSTLVGLPVVWQAFQNGFPVSGTWSGNGPDGQVTAGSDGITYPVTYSVPGTMTMSVTVDGGSPQMCAPSLNVIKLIFKEN